MLLSSSMKLLIFCILFRIASSLFVITHFNPDEYWQSLEPAHYIVYGYGHLTWEYHSIARIRAWIHPFLFALLYKLLQLLHIDNRFMVVIFGISTCKYTAFEKE